SSADSAPCTRSLFACAVARTLLVSSVPRACPSPPSTPTPARTQSSAPASASPVSPNPLQLRTSPASPILARLSRASSLSTSSRASSPTPQPSSPTENFDRRSQASDYHDRPRPAKPKLMLSTFNGNDPEAWLNRAVQYFDLNETEGHDRVKYAAYYLDGEANVWWQWLTSNDFERELLTRYGSSNYHNDDEVLSRIRQTGSLRDYLKEFERLACRVRGWPETALVGPFIGGLKYDLAVEVRLERQESMHAAMEVARRREGHLVATRRGRADARYPETRRAQPDASNMFPSGRPPDSSRPPVPEVKRLSPEETKRRCEKGLCFKCDEKFTLGHHCKQAFFIHVIDDEEPEIEEDWEQEVEIGVPEEEAEISMHAMAGTRGPRTMRLPACVKDRRIVVLVDNGSSHNFINADLSQKLKLPTKRFEPFEVQVANGERLTCSEAYRAVPIKFQGVVIKADLYALPLVGPDVVLGVQWLKGLGKVTTNYRTRVMELDSGEHRVTLKGSKDDRTKEFGLKSIER
ncbi:Unknown protein, partial [Striga hermonthica]